MKLRIQRNERGASLILAIVFMVVVGAVGGGVLASISSGVGSGVSLANARNREYAADAAIETSIARVRVLNASSTTTGCGSDPAYTFERANASDPGITIHVDCFNTPALMPGPGGTLLAQNNVTFRACLKSGAPASGDPCTTSGPPDDPLRTIISATLSFQRTGASPNVQVATYVRSWSVNA